MPHRRYTRLLATAAGLPLALTACGGTDNTGSSGPVDTLSVLDYYNEEPDNTFIQETLDTCAAELDVTLERETVPGENLIQTVLQRSSSRTLPDVLMLDNPDIQEIASTGALSPLSDYDIDTSGFTESVINAATYEGELYGLQPTANTLGLFYNPELLAEAGVEPPQTWDELRTAAAELTEGGQYGIAFSAIASYEGAWQFLPFMWTNGGDETNLDSPEVVEALQLWVDLVNEGSASPSVVNWSQGDARDQFVAGNAAMMINGPWQIPALEESGVSFESVQIPVAEEGQTPIAPLGGEAWTVPVTGDEARQAKAAEFVECLANDENQLDSAIQRNTVPTNPELWDAYIEEVPSMAAFTEQVGNSRARTAELGVDWPETATVIYTGVQLALTGEAAPEDAFARASAG